MSMEEKAKKELLKRLDEGEALMSEFEESMKTQRFSIFSLFKQLQIEVGMLTKLYDREYDLLDNNTLERADRIMSA